MYVEYIKGEKHAKKNADISETLDNFDDAGYILTENELVVDIDCLEIKQIEQLISDFNIKTQIVWTDRGCHFYYKKPDNFRGAQGICAFGFKIEFKHIKNTKSITIKRNGVVREIENKGVREDLPDFFKSNKKNQELLGLSEGDGRNEKLFKQRKILAGFPKWKQIIMFINNVIFDTPLPSKEIETICRDINITAEKDGENLIADLIMRDKHVVKYGESLFFYDGESYINDLDKLNRMVYSYCVGQKTRYVNEVISQMNKRSKLIDPETVFDIKFKNGVLKRGQFVELDYKGFTPYYIDIEYNPYAEPVEIVDNYLKQLCNNDPDYILRLGEIIGHCLITDKEFKRLVAKFFIFVGDGGNGKGTLLAIIRRILTSKNCSALSIDNMGDERYLSSMVGKLANLGDDIEDKAIGIKEMKMLKNISTCDAIESRKMFENSQSVEITTSLIFTSNHILKSFEKGFSYKRRVDWLPMYTKPKKKDPQFITKITEPKALNYWVRLIVEGYMRLYENGQFTESKLVTDFNEKYHEENNTALQYVQDLTLNDILGKRSPEIFNGYETWCDENGVYKQGAKLFNTTLREYHKVKISQKKINGKNQKVYVLGEDNKLELSEN
ncbi:DNA primase [Gemella sp. GH3]|uniref:DNA primase family protein n=1 Tax=unclassified Gemella TaxID=2624949 RepID=UPI0015D06727|nr:MULTISPECIES: DUF5906 domain-containing protein [unclassified Gemella]MBF0714511.1 DNA primase [Gemella sp. GH3.1]NYS51463.1 DNA primase [Gemella sp. GH3]